MFIQHFCVHSSLIRWEKLTLKALISIFIHTMDVHVILIDSWILPCSGWNWILNGEIANLNFLGAGDSSFGVRSSELNNVF